MISKYFANKLYLYNLINEEYIQVYEYGLELLITNLINVLIVLITGLLIHDMKSLLLYMVTFALIRSSSGGYHAKTHSRCITIYMIMAITGMYFIKGISNNLLLAIILIYSEIVIYLLSPIKTQSKKIETHIKKKLQTRTLLNILIINLVIICLIFAGNTFNKYILVIIASLFMQSFTMIIQILIKNKSNRNMGGSLYENY